VIGDAGEHLGEIDLRIAAVEFGGLDRGLDNCGDLARAG